MNPAQLIAGLAKKGLSPKQIQVFLNKAPGLVSKAKLAIPKKSVKGAQNHIDNLIKASGLKPGKTASKLTPEQAKKLAQHKALNASTPRPQRSGKVGGSNNKKAPVRQWLDGVRWGQVEDAAVRGVSSVAEGSGIDPDSKAGKALQGAATAGAVGLSVVQGARGKGSTGLSTKGGLSRAQAGRRAARGQTQSQKGGQTPNPRKNNPERVARQSQRRAERKGTKNKNAGRAEYIAGQRVVKEVSKDLTERATSDQVLPHVEPKGPGKQTIDQRVDNALAIKPTDNLALKGAKVAGRTGVILGEATGVPDAARGLAESSIATAKSQARLDQSVARQQAPFSEAASRVANPQLSAADRLGAAGDAVKAYPGALLGAVQSPGQTITGGIKAVQQMANPAAQNKQAAEQRPLGAKAKLNGKDVFWGGTAYGWQSPESFKMIEESVQKSNTPTNGSFQQNGLGQVVQGLGQVLGGLGLSIPTGK